MEGGVQADSGLSVSRVRRTGSESTRLFQTLVLGKMRQGGAPGILPLWRPPRATRPSVPAQRRARPSSRSSADSPGGGSHGSMVCRVGAIGHPTLGLEGPATRRVRTAPDDTSAHLSETSLASTPWLRAAPIQTGEASDALCRSSRGHARWSRPHRCTPLAAGCPGLVWPAVEDLLAHLREQLPLAVGGPCRLAGPCLLPAVVCQLGQPRAVRAHREQVRGLVGVLPLAQVIGVEDDPVVPRMPVRVARGTCPNRSGSATSPAWAADVRDCDGRSDLMRDRTLPMDGETRGVPLHLHHERPPVR